MGSLKTSSRSSVLLSVGDFFWSGCVIAPLVVTYWRGTWDLLEDWVYPSPSEDSVPENNDPSTWLGWYNQLTGVTCYCLGLFTRIILDLVQYHMKEKLDGRSRWVQVTVSWLYIALYSIAGVSFWRGIWTLMTRDIGLGEAQLGVILILGLMLMLVMKAGQSLLSTPLVITLDKPEVTWANKNYFKKTPEDKGWFVLDVLFTNLVMRHLVVFTWWSLWELENKFLIHKDIDEKDPYVATDSLLMGYAAYIVTVTMDYIIRNIKITKLYITTPLYIATILMGWFATVNVWRGLWSMLDHYWLPKIDHDENYIISHLVSLLLLSLLLVSNSISNDGIIRDEESATIVNIRYWGQFNSNTENNDEMIPIVE